MTGPELPSSTGDITDDDHHHNDDDDDDDERGIKGQVDPG